MAKKINLDVAPEVSIGMILCRLREWVLAADTLHITEDSELTDFEWTAANAFEYLQDIVEVALEYRDDPEVGRLAKAVLALATR